MKINEFINEPFVKGRNIIDNLFTFIFKIPNGGDILLFYDYKKYKIVKEIIGYSFDISQNCLYIIQRTNKNDTKIKLLCSCKNNKNENGILLIIFYLNNKNEMIVLFIKTGNVGISCFCSLLKNDKNKKMDYYNEKDENKDISYFLAGGNDKNKKKPMIQLYKIIFDSINSNIEPIHDIDIEI